jgi:sec-independent protein translocase protein TatB
MFDIGASELLLIAVVAIVAIGPKDLPLALRTAGRWIAKVRKVSGHFRSGVETMIREAELEELEKEWQAKNAEIMSAHPPGVAAEDALVGQDPGTTFSEPLVADAPAKPAKSVKPRKAKPKAKAD